MFNRSDISMAKNQIGSMNRVLRVVEIIDNGYISRFQKKKNTKINLSSITLFIPFKFIKIFKKYKCIFIYTYMCFWRFRIAKYFFVLDIILY